MWDWHNINRIVHHLIHQVQIKPKGIPDDSILMNQRKQQKWSNYVELLSKNISLCDKCLMQTQGIWKWSGWVAFTLSLVHKYPTLLKLHCVDMAMCLFASIIPVPCLAPWQGQASVKESWKQDLAFREWSWESKSHWLWLKSLHSHFHYIYSIHCHLYEGISQGYRILHSLIHFCGSLIHR